MDFNEVKKCVKRPEIALTIAVLIIIILYLMFYKTENYKVDYKNGYQVYTSGATIRRLGQKFTSTNQGVYTTIHNADLSGTDSKPIEVVVFPASNIPSFLISKN